MKTDKNFEDRFAVGWEEGEKMLIHKNRKFWKRAILLFFTLFPFSLILGFIFVWRI